MKASTGLEETPEQKAKNDAIINDAIAKLDKNRLSSNNNPVDIRGVLLEPSESESASVISSTTSLGEEEVPLAIFSSAPTYEEIQKYEKQDEDHDSKSNCCLNTTSLYSNFTKFLSKISNKLSAPFSILNKGFNALRTRVSNQTQETKKDALDHPSTKKETPSPSTLPTSALQMVANAHAR
jgi:hypothetical protein